MIVCVRCRERQRRVEADDGRKRFARADRLRHREGEFATGVEITDLRHRLLRGRMAQGRWVSEQTEKTIGILIHEAENKCACLIAVEAQGDGRRRRNRGVQLPIIEPYGVQRGIRQEERRGVEIPTRHRRAIGAVPFDGDLQHAKIEAALGVELAGLAIDPEAPEVRVRCEHRRRRLQPRNRVVFRLRRIADVTCPGGEVARRLGRRDHNCRRRVCLPKRLQCRHAWLRTRLVLAQAENGTRLSLARPAEERQVTFHADALESPHRRFLPPAHLSARQPILVRAGSWLVRQQLGQT